MLTKEDILRKTNNGLDVFRHYIAGDWKPGKNFRNPFYDDRNASANVWYCKKSATYQFKDFGNEDFSGDCFSLVGRMMSLDCSRKEDFISILEKIGYDLNIGDYSYTNSTTVRSTTPLKTVVKQEISSNNAPTKSGPISKTNDIPAQSQNSSTISVSKRKFFSSGELAWWASYHVNETILNQYQVESIEKIVFSKNEWYASDNEPAFLYSYGDKESSQKIYCPHSRIRFSYIRKKEEDYFGFQQLPEKGKLVILTGGEKDVLTLSAAGYAAFCLNSETATPSNQLMQELKQRFKYVGVLYDMDETGLRCSEKICKQYEKEITMLHLQLPLEGSKKEKDISDYACKLNDKEVFQYELERIISEALAACYAKLLLPYQAGVINYNQPPVQPEAVIRLGNEVAATPGDLVCITGGSGTGKSNYISCLISGALNTKKRKIDTLGLQILSNSEGKGLLYFDTEQSAFQSYQNLQRLLERAHIDYHPEELAIVNLCKTDRRKRKELIRLYMNIYNEKYRGIHLVVIDGLADLISSANEEAEAIQLVEELQQLAQEYNTVIAGIVHTAGIQDKVRGHLGSEITRKASAVISIDKDKKDQHSIVKPLKLRAGNINQAGTTLFYWDDTLKRHVSGN